MLTHGTFYIYILHEGSIATSSVSKTHPTNPPSSKTAKQMNTIPTPITAV